MKKADEWFKLIDNVDIDASEVRDIIRQIQIDAIEATVKRCAENVEHKWDERTDTELFDIDKESILQVAEELKKELE